MREALYHKDDPAVLEKFKASLLLELLEKCMHHNDPHNWNIWMRSTHARQAILTSLKAHRTDDSNQRTPSPIKEYLSTLPSTLPTTPLTIPMEINKVYMVPAQQKPEMQNDTERQQGLRHLCKGQGHIQRYCSKKVIEALAPIMHTKATTVSPLVLDQELKCPQSPTMTTDEALHYLKRQPPEK